MNAFFDKNLLINVVSIRKTAFNVLSYELHELTNIGFYQVDVFV